MEAFTAGATKKSQFEKQKELIEEKKRVSGLAVAAVRILFLMMRN